MRHLVLPILLLLASCSLQKMALRSASPMFKESSDKLTREGSWDFFRESAPGNLKFLEMMSLSDPQNLILLGTLIKGYTGYAYAVPETLALGDDLAGVENSKWKREAIVHYTRAFDYGLSYLKQKDISASDLLDADDDKLKK